MCKTSLNIDLIGVPWLVLRSFAPVPCFLPTMSLKQQFCYLDLFLLQDSSPFILEKSWLQFLKAPMVCFKYPFFQFTSSAQEVEPRGGCGWCVVWGELSKPGRNGGCGVCVWGAPSSGLNPLGLLGKPRGGNDPVVQFKGSSFYAFLGGRALQHHSNGIATPFQRIWFWKDSLTVNFKADAVFRAQRCSGTNVLLWPEFKGKTPHIQHCGCRDISRQGAGITNVALNCFWKNEQRVAPWNNAARDQS